MKSSAGTRGTNEKRADGVVNRKTQNAKQRIMLYELARGKKPIGAARRPTPTAQALAAYLLTRTTSTTLTQREAAALIDRDARSCKKAVDDLISYGVNIAWLTDEAFTFTLAAADTRPGLDPFEDPVEDHFEDQIPDYLDSNQIDRGKIQIPESSNRPAPIGAGRLPALDLLEVESEEAEFEISRESADEQLSLFGGVYSAPPEPEEMPCAAYILKPPEDEKTDLAQTLRKPCADVEQSLSKDRAETAQTAPEPPREPLPAALEEAMRRLSATFDGLPSSDNLNAQARARPPVPKKKQEINLNQSSKEAFSPTLKQRARFDAAERERRRREILEKLPELATKAAEHVVGTLANMMAFGTMPESVFYTLLEETAAPTVRSRGAFLNYKVQALKQKYRYSADT